MSYQDKVAIVTGGASGIGKALCLALGQAGARVVVVDINEAGAVATAAAILGRGGKAEARALDVRYIADLDGMVQDVAARHGTLDYMFNNASLAVEGETRDLTQADWKLAIDVNLMAVIHGSLAAYRVMTAQGSGHIVNTASAAGLAPIPILTAYSTTKFGVVGFSEGLRAEAAGLGVKVTTLCPGFIETRIFGSSVSVGASSGEMRSLIPLPLLNAEDSARRILKDVARNKALVVFPFYARLITWLYRLFPGLSALISRKIVRDFRAIRKEGYRDVRKHD